MYLNKSDIIRIKDFFESKEISDAFIELYKFEESKVSDIEYEIRDNLIGAKRSGERLRFYINKGKDGEWYFKVKNKERYKFNIGELSIYKKQIEYVNDYFKNNPGLIRLKKADDGEFSVERSVNAKTSVNAVVIKNLKLKEKNKVIEELNFLSEKGVQTVDIRIYSK